MCASRPGKTTSLGNLLERKYLVTHPTSSGPESLRVGLKTCIVIHSPDDFGTYSTLTTTILNEHESSFLGTFANLLLMLLVVVGSGVIELVSTVLWKDSISVNLFGF